MVLPRFPKIVGQRFDIGGFLTVSIGLMAVSAGCRALSRVMQ